MPLGSNANERQCGLELRERKGPLLELGEFDDINNSGHPGTGYMLGKGRERQSEGWLSCF